MNLAPTKNLFIKTYGCQMNVYDSLKMQELLEPFGYAITDNMELSDIVILNTCHIREKAAEKMYSELGRVKKLKDQRKLLNNKDNIIIVVAGCTAQAEGEEIFSRAPYVDIIVGPQSFHSLPELINILARKEKKHLIELDFIEEKKFDILPETFTSQGASAFISVQEGCDKFCTFCVVPYTRGAEFSRPIEQIYRETIKALSLGSKEIILLGQNVNAYHGVDSEKQEIDLADLIEHLSTIKELDRIRYITSHPMDMNDKLINLHGSQPKLMPFLHLPVQSGSNKILKNMNRKHTREHYFEIIDKLRSKRPDIVFSSDFIVGFPGESDEDFADTLDLVQRVRFGQCYSFKYSPRPGTPAASKEQILEPIKNARLAILQTELSRQQFEYNKACVGKIMPVLFEKAGKLTNQLTGRSPYMQSVHIINDDITQFKGHIAYVKIINAHPISLSGELVSSNEQEPYPLPAE